MELVSSDDSLLKPVSKTRIAPTPSGYLHLGNVLSFGITAAIAKKHGAEILLRIDDLDRERANPLYIADIFDTLNFLGIHWQRGPRDRGEFENIWSQLHRIHLYNEAINYLQNAGKLFVCTCSRVEYIWGKCTCIEKQLPFDTPSANWRIISDKCRLGVKQIDGSVLETELPLSMKNFIIRKKDGYPSYQLASVIDDVHYSTDLIVRGQDLWDSTLAQLYLADILGEIRFANSTFYHHRLITYPNGEKLSKSAAATSINQLRKSGHTAASVLTLVLTTAGIKGQAETWDDFVLILADHYKF